MHGTPFWRYCAIKEVAAEVTGRTLTVKLVDKMEFPWSLLVAGKMRCKTAKKKIGKQLNLHFLEVWELDQFFGESAWQILLL